MIPLTRQIESVVKPVSMWIIEHPDAVVVMMSLVVCVAMVITFSDQTTKN